MSPLRSSAGPAVWTRGASSSRAAMCASDVLPRPGGPASSTWSSGSPRRRAASMKRPSCALTGSWPTNSSSALGAQRAVEILLPGTRRRDLDADLAGRRAHAALTAVRSAAAINSSGAASSPAAADRILEHRLGLGGVVAKAHEAFAREHPRAGRRPSPPRARPRARRRCARAAPRSRAPRSCGRCRARPGSASRHPRRSPAACPARSIPRARPAPSSARLRRRRSGPGTARAPPRR